MSFQPINSEAFAAMSAESKRTGWPKHYREDIQRDGSWLGAIPPFTFNDWTSDCVHESGVRFVWILRDCGTHLLTHESMIPVSADPSNNWFDAIRRMDEREGKGYRLYAWDGRRLKRTTWDAARRLLESEARRKESTVRLAAV